MKLSLEQINNISEIDIIYKKISECRSSDRPTIRSSQDAYEVLIYYWNSEKIELLEEFKVLFLNHAHRVNQIFTVSQGGISGTVADPRIILAMALKIAASNIILCHNHPSGSLKPSRADEELTTKIKCAAAYFDIKLLDHLIITSESYFSFADGGIL